MQRHYCLFCAVVLALALWLPALAAGPATRVVDINTTQTNPVPAPTDSSIPQHLLAVGSTLYFSADGRMRKWPNPSAALRTCTMYS